MALGYRPLDMAFHVHIVTEDPNHMNPGGGETVKCHMTVNMVLPIPLANIIAGYPDLGVIDDHNHSFSEFVIIFIGLAVPPIFE
jgi:hypothetical protein